MNMDEVKVEQKLFIKNGSLFFLLKLVGKRNIDAVCSRQCMCGEI